MSASDSEQKSHRRSRLKNSSMQAPVTYSSDDTSLEKDFNNSVTSCNLGAKYSHDRAARATTTGGAAAIALSECVDRPDDELEMVRQERWADIVHTGLPSRACGTSTKRPTALEPAGAPLSQSNGHYWSPKNKFLAAATFSLIWLGFSIWVSLPWLNQAGAALGIVPAIIAISLLAYIPGLLVAFLTASLLLDRQPPARVVDCTAPVTVLIAARNEQSRIAETIRYLAAQDYEGSLQVLVVDNGSTDQTTAIACSTAEILGVDLRTLGEPKPGKSHALNAGLLAVPTNLVITLDADTLLHPSAIRHLVGRIQSSPHDVSAVAGCVLVRNSRSSWLARLQEWDYFVGIASVKRMQALFQGTLVAQGAFSIYRTNEVRAVGGWPDAIGEDIVLTWRLMHGGDRVYFEPLAVAFTDVPEGFGSLARQRMRWARGMIEALRAIPPWRQRRGFAKVLTAIDLIIPLLDGAYVFLFLPGIILASFGIFWFVGPMTALVLPLTLTVYGLLSRYQRRRVFEPLGLHVRRNRFGFVCFLFFYQMFMSSFSIIGYTQELFGARRKWK